MAIPTEDHPIEYANFEGVIPEGQYGAGVVIVWDRGTYTNLRDDISLEEALGRGKLEIFLNGEKLKGGFLLIRTSMGEKQNKSQKGVWLLIKIKDQYANLEENLLLTKPKSIVSGKDVDDFQ